MNIPARMSQSLTADPSVVHGFLDRVFRHVADRGLIEIAYSDAGGAIKYARLFENSETGRQDAARFACDVNAAPGSNVYFAPALRALNTDRGKRARKADVLGPPMLWADFDDPGAIEEAIHMYRGLAIPHEIVVTGRVPHTRVQLFWVLDDLATDPRLVDELLAGIHIGLGCLGDPKVVNVDRVMRLPGCVSWPKPGKEGRIAELTESSAPDHRPETHYTFAELEAYYPRRDPIQARRETGPTQLDDLLMTSLPKSEDPEASSPFAPRQRAETNAPVVPPLPEAGFNLLGRRVNGRETYARDLIFAVIGEEAFRLGRWPRAEEIHQAAWPIYIAKCAPKQWRTGDLLADLEAEGRGQTWFWEKCQVHAIRASEGAISDMPNVEAAKKLHQERQSRNLAGAEGRDVSTPASMPSDQFGAARFQLLNSGDFIAGYRPADYVLDGVLRRGWLYTFTAPTGHGKTAVVTSLAQCIATGTPLLEKELAQGAVLFLAGENPDDVRARYIASLEGDELAPDDIPLFFADGVFSIRRHLPEIAAQLEAAGVALSLVIVDTLAAYFDGDEPNNNAQQQEFATTVLRALTRLPGNPTVIVPAHPVKNATKSNLVPMGGSALLNQVDGNLTAWLDGGIVTVHWQGKFRGAPFDPMQFELLGTTSDRLIDSRGRQIPTVLARPLTIQRGMKLASETERRENMALELIDRNPLISETAIADDLGVSRSTANRIKKRLRDKKWIKRAGRGYTLTSEGRKVIAP